jgi:hypothetical protein
MYSDLIYVGLHIHLYLTPYTFDQLKSRIIHYLHYKKKLNSCVKIISKCLGNYVLIDNY